jgi:hypothetical protein
MTIDLSGGLPASREDMLPERPSDPEMREAVNIWLHDDEGRFSLPRIGIEAIGADWDNPAVVANMAFSDGRVFVGSCSGPAGSPLDDHGRPTRMIAGPVRFDCLEPFKRWTMDWNGPALATTISDQAKGIVPDGPYVDVEIHVDMTMVVPPWIQGQMGRQAADLLEKGIEGLFMGGERYEQLFRASGTFRVGDETLDFTATGLRIHRQGVRNTNEFRGHCWQSTVFPSGKAFGYIAFPDNPDGSAAYREGYVFDGEQMLPATIVEAPWMSHFQAEGGDVSCVLETSAGTARIAGSTTTTTALAGSGSINKVDAMRRTEARHSLFFHQGGAHYSWDGEEVYGMVERSLPVDQVAID